MTKKFWSALILLGAFAVSFAPAALCCGLEGAKSDKAADPDDETAMSDVEKKTAVA